MWSESEVSCLVTIWGDANIQEQLDGATRNKSFYLRISRKLQDEQRLARMSNKNKNLKGDCTKVKDHNAVTGNNRKTCKFFHKLDAILGHRPASAPSSLLDNGSSPMLSATESQLQNKVEEETGDKQNQFYAVTVPVKKLLPYSYLQNPFPVVRRTGSTVRYN